MTDQRLKHSPPPPFPLLLPPGLQTGCPAPFAPSTAGTPSVQRPQLVRQNSGELPGELSNWVGRSSTAPLPQGSRRLTSPLACFIAAVWTVVPLAGSDPARRTTTVVLPSRFEGTHLSPGRPEQHAPQRQPWLPSNNTVSQAS